MFYMNLRRIFTLEHLIGDVRSAIVGGTMGAVTSIVVALFTASALVTYSVFPSVDGWAMPLPALVDHARSEDRSLEIKFQPEDVQETFVCEFAQVSAATYKELFLEYMDRYQGCFELAQVHENTFRISPNAKSGMMTKTAGSSWQCKCGN